MSKYQTTEVFGVSNDNIKSYIEREKVDSLFKMGLSSKKHLIIFGSSKQGKTALTNRHLTKDNFIRTNCSSETKPVDIYRSILRQEGINFVAETNTSETMEGSFSGGVKAKVDIPFVTSTDANLDSNIKGSKTNGIKYQSIDFNLGLPQDICEILIKNNFKKRIIIENFHYLQEDIQKDLAYHLRIFEDSHITFIILGIWREKNRLAQFNGDLQDRLVEIPVEPWLKDDFKKIVEKGESYLNVDFSKIFDKLVELSFDSVGVFQELCKEVCLSAGVSETSKNKIIFNEKNLEDAKDKKIEDYSGRHIRALETFIQQQGKGSEEIPLYLAYYFIKFLFDQDFKKIFSGLSRKQIHDGIKQIHHRGIDVRSSDMSYFLHNIVSSQIKKKIVPPLFDYDMSIKTLKIIDSTFYFFIRNADLEDVLESFDIPDGVPSQQNT